MSSKRLLKTTITFFLLVISVWLSTHKRSTGFINQSLAQSPSPSPKVDTKIDPKVVQDIIENVVGEKSSVKKAWLGTLESLANSTLTLKSEDATRLASVSAQTTIIRSNKKSSLEDLSLGDHLIVMGYINGNEVLDARRILASDTAPAIPKHQSFFGQIVTIDPKEDTITVKHLQNEETTTFELTSKSILNLKTDSDLEPIEIDGLNPNQLITIIYLPSEKDKLPVLVQTLVLPLPESETNPEASESAEINPSPTPESTPKSTPTELQD